MGISACDACYRRKIQCSIPTEDELCNWCRHHGLACTFTREIQQKKRKRAKLSDIQELQSRIQQLESALAQSHEDTQPGITVNPRNAQSCLESPLGQNWYHQGMPIVSDKGQAWVSAKTGEAVVWRKLKLFGNRLDSPRSSPSQGLLNLPSKETVQIALGAFFRSSFPLAFPVLDMVLFEETLESAYKTSDVPPQNLKVSSASACVMAALALICRLKESRGILVGVDGDICAMQAQECLGRIIADPSLTNLQTVLILHRHRASAGHREDAILLHAMACRMVCRLGGHITQAPESDNPGISLDQRRYYHIRRLFWLCYMLDKDISLRTGQPPLLAGDYCDLTGSPRVTNCIHHSEWDQADCDCGSPSVSKEDLQFGLLKEKIHILLFSPRAFQISDCELLLRIRQLDSELESWRLSTPHDIRPRLSISQNHPLVVAETNTAETMQCLVFHLEYHYLLTVIHTTARRCGAESAEAGDMPEDLHSAMHSSTDLSLEASRSTLLLLRSSVRMLPEESFCHFVFYPTVAAMSLFVNILLHPLSSQSELDVDILGGAASIIQSMPVDALTYEDLKHMQELTEFVLELVRLGRCAVVKAKREEKC
ncbi:hypothetical protein GQ53DRAFT_713061 [Thozetella sp. PMI_491]|nr:hypothetical protein GQ53DRAFT_713061 [Thozetella sp. PMI_491]